jgi:hypothetical protein
LTSSSGRVIEPVFSRVGEVGRLSDLILLVEVVVMLFPFSDPATGTDDSPKDFKSNYNQLKRIINQAIKQGSPVETLGLISKSPAGRAPRQLTREDLLRLLKIIRRIKSRYSELLQPPVPRELERDILAKAESERLPWEVEALEKIECWRRDVQAVRAQVQKELNDHLKREIFQGI